MREVVQRHLAPGLLALHLYGSALDGGLQPRSDIDLMAAVAAPLDERVRQALLRGLLAVSAPPGSHPTLRALELTVLVRNDVVPWLHPARRELQFGEWLRADIEAGRFEPPGADADLAILLTQLRQRSLALLGPPADGFFDPVPASDFHAALGQTLALWNHPADWASDERHVVLTLARLWYSAATGRIAPKHRAADWALARLPPDRRPLLAQARQAYLGQGDDRLAARAGELAAWVAFMKRGIRDCLDGAPS